MEDDLKNFSLLLQSNCQALLVFVDVHGVPTAQARASAAEQVVGPSKEPHNEAEEAIDEATKAKSDAVVQAAEVSTIKAAEVSTVKAAVAAQAADIPPTRARADAAVQVALQFCMSLP